MITKRLLVLFFSVSVGFLCGMEKENEEDSVFQRELDQAVKESPERMKQWVHQSPASRIDGLGKSLKGTTKQKSRKFLLAKRQLDYVDPGDPRHFQLGDDVAKIGLGAVSSSAAEATPGSFEYHEAISRVSRKDPRYRDLKEFAGNLSPSSPARRGLANRFELAHIMAKDKKGRGGHVAPVDDLSFERDVVQRDEGVVPVVNTRSGVICNAKNIFPRDINFPKFIEDLEKMQISKVEIARFIEENKKGVVGDRVLYDVPGYPFKVEALESGGVGYGVDTGTTYPIFSFAKWVPGGEIKLDKLKDLRSDLPVEDLEFSSSEARDFAQAALAESEKNLRYRYINKQGKDVAIVDIGSQVKPVLRGVYIEFPVDVLDLLEKPEKE